MSSNHSSSGQNKLRCRYRPFSVNWWIYNFNQKYVASNCFASIKLRYTVTQVKMR